MRKPLFVILLSVSLLVPTMAAAQRTSDTTTLVAPEQSQVPRLIRFSGMVGAHEDRTVGITFTIYKDQTGGAPVWQEVQNVGLDSTGHYSVLLGTNSKDGIPIELFTGNDARWLGVQVEQEAEQPRVLLVSVPYALKASDADTVGGMPASAFALAGATPVPAGTVPTVAAATATASLSPTSVTALATSGTANYVAKFLNTTDLGISSIYDSGSAVSIGGTENLGALTFIGYVPFGDAPGIALYNKGGGSGASVSLDFYNTPFNGGIPQAKVKAVDDGNYSDHLTFWTKPPGNSGLNPVAERVRITSSGNVGIGTPMPGSKLSVDGNIYASGEIDANGGVATNWIGTFGSCNPCTLTIQAGNLAAVNLTLSGGITASGNITTTSNAIIGGGLQTNGGGGLTVNNGALNVSSASANSVIEGNLNVNGTLYKHAGSFKIDHPLDPTNKYLYHSFVESPDMLNIYNGIVVLDRKGEAVVEMPDWFEALNRDFRYQLTAIGAPGPGLYIASKISGNRFKIAGGTTGLEVSWQVTGIRQDAYAQAHRIPVEEVKPAAEQGTYSRPELF